MKLRAGTSGFSYKAWKGSFYPEDLASDRMLAYYGERLPAVEINSTFYRLPKASVLESWAARVPADFRFSIKASRRITHFKRLKRSADETSYLVATAETLGPRLGALLFQLPPNFKQDVERLADFLELLPADVPATFEFRHSSWFDDATFTALADRNCALCIADTGGESDPPRVATADWGYLRLRRQDYEAADLADWRHWVAQQQWSRALVFFKHEDEGTGPRLAARFLELSGT
ncbi:MAG: DUF72 domain-containing protein [Acidobacteria bacterium]|nr:DUF72 domain-containing protein [Acidobacteriota bacterium]